MNCPFSISSESRVNFETQQGGLIYPRGSTFFHLAPTQSPLVELAFFFGLRYLFHIPFTFKVDIADMKNLWTALLVLSSIGCFAQSFLVTDFGAVGDGSTVNTNAIQSAIDSCHSSGGGEVVVAGGSFATGTIRLKSNVVLRIESGAELQGSTSISDYPDIEPPLPTYINNYTKKALIYAEDEHHIGIVGEGTVNGQGVFLAGENERPFGIRFISCQNVTIEDVRLEASGFWMMNNLDVDTMVIRNVDIFNHTAGNNDGLSLDGCRNVLIEDCTVDSNNDPIVIKTTSPAIAENIEVRNCTVSTWKRAIKIGTETHSGIRNIHIHDVDVEWSSLAVPALGIGVADCGINLAIVDGGFMENVLVEDVTIEGVNTSIFIRLGNRGRVWESGLPAPPVGYLKNVVLRNVSATQESNISCSITGIPGYKGQNISLENISVDLPGGESDFGSGFSVPENEDGKPENFMFGEDLPAYGLYVRHIDSLHLENVCFNLDQPDGRPGIILDDVTSSPNYTVPSGGTMNCVELASNINDLDKKTESWIGDNWVLQVSPQIGRVDIALFNCSGQLLLSKNQVSQVGLSALKPGLYFIVIRSEDLTERIKFVKI